LPAIEDYWLRDSAAVLFLETHFGHCISVKETISCGPASLAAFVGVSCIEKLLKTEIIRNQTDWMNRREMEFSLQKLGLKYTKIQKSLPKHGICLIQWEGPWLGNMYRGSNLMHTHWVAVAGDYIFDILWGGWLPSSVWQDVVVEDLIGKRNLADGWSPLTSYEFDLTPSQ